MFQLTEIFCNIQISTSILSHQDYGTRYHTHRYLFNHTRDWKLSHDVNNISFKVNNISFKILNWSHYKFFMQHVISKACTLGFFPQTT